MKGTALICSKKGCMELQEQEIANPGKNEIQIRVLASLISSGTERAFVLGMDNAKASYPFNPGYCAAGIVERVGEEATGFAVGDRVTCYILGHQSIGNVDKKWAVHIPEGISFEEAAFMPLGVTSMQGVRKARIEMGEQVMILGLGLIGQLALQFAAFNGSSPVIGVDRIDKRLKLAVECGADLIYNSADDNWIEDLKKQNNGKLPQVVIESTGFPEAVSVALQAVGPFGRVILLGSTRGESTVNFYRDVHKKAVTVIGAHVNGNPQSESYPGYWSWQDNAECFMQLLKREKISIRPLITEIVEWEKAEDMYGKILSWNADIMGAIIKWNGYGV